MAECQVTTLEAHQAYLNFSQGLFTTLANTVQTQFDLLAHSEQSVLLKSGSNAVSTAVPKPQAASRKIALDRDACLEFARGSVAKVLGAEFGKVDTFPTRVRLPDEPLMLVDRIVEIKGKARSMTNGSVVTEHDIHPGAWYLDCGRIPTCIAVEAGQADLFLSGYLGIDFHTEGHGHLAQRFILLVFEPCNQNAVLPIQNAGVNRKHIIGALPNDHIAKPVVTNAHAITTVRNLHPQEMWIIGVQRTLCLNKHAPETAPTLYRQILHNY